MPPICGKKTKQKNGIAHYDLSASLTTGTTARLEQAQRIKVS